MPAQQNLWAEPDSAAPSGFSCQLSVGLFKCGKLGGSGALTLSLGEIPRKAGGPSSRRNLQTEAWGPRGGVLGIEAGVSGSQVHGIFTKSFVDSVEELFKSIIYMDFIIYFITVTYCNKNETPFFHL